MYVNQDILTIYVNVFVFVKMMMTRRMLRANDKKIIRLDKMKSYAEAAQHKPNLLIHFFLSLETMKDYGSISPTFYEQLLRSQIPIAQKRQSGQAAFCAYGICACNSHA